jgi:hypothetical protein
VLQGWVKIMMPHEKDERTYQSWIIRLKNYHKKFLLMSRICMVAHGIAFIVGVWLAIVAFLMRDILHFLLFIGVLFVLYVLTAIHLYRSTHRKSESEIHQNKSKIHLTGFAAIQFGERGNRLTLPRRP